MSGHTLSVVMPNYNHAHFIGEALEAILTQSFRPQEVIVIDDCSTDNSLDVIEHYVRRDPIIHLLRNDQNRGGHYAVHQGLDIAKGEYIYFAAADDKILPGFFEKSIDLLKRNPRANLCSADMALIDEQGSSLGEYRAAAVPVAAFLPPQEVLAQLYKDPNYIIGGTSIYRRSSLIEVGGFDAELMGLSDWFTQRAIALKDGACYIPEVLFLWRQTDMNYSAAAFRDTQRMFEVIAHAVRLMRSPQYCQSFPPDFVKFWSRWFGAQVMNGAWAQLAQRRRASLDELHECAKESGLSARLFQRALSLTTGAELLFCKLYLKKLCLPARLKEIERLTN